MLWENYMSMIDAVDVEPNQAKVTLFTWSLRTTQAIDSHCTSHTSHTPASACMEMETCNTLRALQMLTTSNAMNILRHVHEIEHEHDHED